MSPFDELRALTQRITTAAHRGLSSGNLVQPIPVEDARRIYELLAMCSEDEVTTWLHALHGQPGSIQALCAAERALTDRSLDDTPQTLGDLLEGWVDLDVYHWLIECDEAAAAYTRQHAPERDAPHIFRIYAAEQARPEDRSLQVRMHISPWPNKESMLWDEHGIGDSDPVALAIAIAYRGVVHFQVSPKPSLAPSPGPLDRYHPERFLTYHPAVRGLRAMARARHQQHGAVCFTMDDFNRIQGVVATEANQHLSELPLARRKDLPPLGAATLGQAGSLAAHVLMWMSAGQQIYDLPPVLAERFLQTDVDDVPLSMLRFPYDALFIHWGAQPDMELEPGWRVDGAYVTSGVPGVLQIVVTAV